LVEWGAKDKVADNQMLGFSQYYVLKDNIFEIVFKILRFVNLPR
jgi:hypothetical protein